MSTLATIARFGYWPLLALTFFLTFLLVAAWALAVPARADAGSKPARPAGLSVDTQQGSLDVEVDWDDVAGATSYSVRWRVAGPNNPLNEGVDVQASSADITVANYGEWVVRIEACNTNGCGQGAAKRFTVAPAPTPVPQPPTWATTETTGELPENDTAESLVDLRATDPDGADSQISYAITAGDKTVFSLTAKQTGTLHYVSLDYAGSAQNYEALTNPATFATVTVRATDESGLTVDRTVTISVTDVNERPTVSGPSSISYAEDSTADLATFTVSDPDAGQKYNWTMSGVDGGYVDIYASVATTSARTLFFVQPNYENKTSYALQVKVTDNGNPPLTGTLDVAITITDANDAPEFTEGASATRSLPENSAANVNVGAAISATDEDGDTRTYSLKGTDAASFTIDSATGQLSTKVGVTYDYETKRSYSVTVTATDTGSPALADSITVTVNLTDVNEAPACQRG